MGNCGKVVGLTHCLKLQIRSVFVRFVLVSATLIFANSMVSAGECRENQVFLRGDWGQARFSVELADDDQERARGLMFRESMAKSAGMLFIYPEPIQANFWMKNTLIPLDIIFLDATGTVKRVHHNAIPHDTSRINGGSGILAVLEINGGMAKALGIAEGSQLRHPAFSTDKAAWSC